MRRKIYQELEDWKKDWSGKTCLLLNGARRVGKSYIVEEFAKANYKSHILIDFQKATAEVKDLFWNYLNDLDYLFQALSIVYKVKLFKRETLFIFDEVQMFPRARAALKYLVADGRYDFIETGSLVSIKKNVKDIVIPSEERHIFMYPMDFEEFLWATENLEMMEMIRTNFDRNRPMGAALHRQAMDLFRQYLIVGGMPQAVQEYVTSRDLEKVDRIKRDILNLYRGDINKHSEEYALETLDTFNSIPSMLSRHEKKFKASDIKEKSKSRTYRKPLIWLSESMIANLCFNSTDPNIGLNLNRDARKLKCYMGDTGLLLSLAFNDKELIGKEILQKILLGKLEFNEGMIFENIIAQMLRCSGHQLYFYSNPSRRDSSSRMELDFIITKRSPTNRHNICPIEVKSGKNYTLSSIRKYEEKFKEYCGPSYVIHTKDLKVEGSTIYLPAYMTCLL